MSFEHFQAFVEETQNVNTVDELVGILLKKVKPLGYDRMIFCLFSEHKHIGLSAGVGYLNNYPDDWMEYYAQQGFDRVDPVISCLRESSETFAWEDMPKKFELTKKQKLCLSMGEEAKLYNGVATPIWGANRFSALGFATTEKNDACNRESVTLDLIHAFSNHFYLVFERLHKKKHQLANDEFSNIVLTSQEHEVLSWASRGKSNTDISDILFISVSTVKYHMQNIYKKLGVNDRVVACTKAISLGLIYP